MAAWKEEHIKKEPEKESLSDAKLIDLSQMSERQRKYQQKICQHPHGFEMLRIIIFLNKHSLITDRIIQQLLETTEYQVTAFLGLKQFLEQYVKRSEKSSSGHSFVLTSEQFERLLTPVDDTMLRDLAAPAFGTRSMRMAILTSKNPHALYEQVVFCRAVIRYDGQIRQDLAEIVRLLERLKGVDYTRVISGLDTLVKLPASLYSEKIRGLAILLDAWFRLQTLQVRPSVDINKALCGFFNQIILVSEPLSSTSSSSSSSGSSSFQSGDLSGAEGGALSRFGMMPTPMVNQSTVTTSSTSSSSSLSSTGLSSVPVSIGASGINALG